MHAPSKVGNLQVATMIQEQVFGLDVAMNDVLAMTINQRVGQLLDVKGRPILRETHRLFQVAVQFSLGGEFENEVDARGVVKVSVQAEDIGVPQVALDLNLAAQLVLYVALLQLALRWWKAESQKVCASEPLPWRTPRRPRAAAALAAWRCCCGCGRALKSTLSATMYLLCFSRAKYTLPNLPRPSGLPMSKSVTVQRFSGAGAGGAGVAAAGRWAAVGRNASEASAWPPGAALAALRGTAAS